MLRFNVQLKSWLHQLSLSHDRVVVKINCQFATLLWQNKPRVAVSFSLIYMNQSIDRSIDQSINVMSMGDSTNETLIYWSKLIKLSSTNLTNLVLSCTVLAIILTSRKHIHTTVRHTDTYKLLQRSKLSRITQNKLNTGHIIMQINVHYTIIVCIS